MKKLFVVLMSLAALTAASTASARSIQWQESFKMFDEPKHVLQEGCDVITNLTIDYFNKEATLENKVVGLCRLYVEPDTRTYKLDIGKSNASGNIYHGTRETPIGQDTIEIKDFRNSILEIAYSAMIMTHETRADGRVIRLYSDF